MKKNSADLITLWLEKGKRDLAVAENEPYFDIVCFHSQQAAEKFLKAYLIFLGVDYPKTHDLGDLVLLLAEKDPEILKLKAAGDELTPFAVEARYPEFLEPAPEDAQRAKEIAEKFKEYVLEKLK